MITEQVFAVASDKVKNTDNNNVGLAQSYTICVIYIRSDTTLTMFHVYIMEWFLKWTRVLGMLR